MIPLGGHLYKMKDSATNIMHEAGRSPGLLFDSTSQPATSQNLDFSLSSGVQNPHEFFPIRENSGRLRVDHLRHRASIPQANYFHDVAALPWPAARLAQQ